MLDYDAVSAWLAAAEKGHSYHREGVLHALMQLQHVCLEEAEQIVQRYVETEATTQELYAHLQQLVAPRRLIDKTPAYAHAVETFRHA